MTSSSSCGSGSSFCARRGRRATASSSVRFSRSIRSPTASTAARPNPPTKHLAKRTHACLSVCNQIPPGGPGGIGPDLNGKVKRTHAENATMACPTTEPFFSHIRCILALQVRSYSDASVARKPFKIQVTTAEDHRLRGFPESVPARSPRDVGPSAAKACTDGKTARTDLPEASKRIPGPCC